MTVASTREPLSTKKAIIEDLHDRLNGEMRKHQIESVYGQVIEQIIDELKHNGSYRLGDLGSFQTVFTPEREGRNPRTGETMTVAAAHRIKFKPGQVAKRSVNDRH